MQINIPKFGTGVPAIFNGNPIKVPPASGKLQMAGGNIAKSGTNTRKIVEHSNQSLERFAKSPKGSLDIRA